MLKEVGIRPISKSRLHTVDMNNIPFGRIFSDHMLMAKYEEGEWTEAEIVPYDNLSLAPSISVLSYGQSVFEGMKASRGPLGEPMLFRPEDNFRRMNFSATRLCMPEIPQNIFLDGLYKLIKLDEAWIPPAGKGSLYIRPVMFAVDRYVGIKPSSSYMFLIFTCPVGPYYTEPVNLLASKEYIRAAPGGVGTAKAAGNYAASLLAAKEAKRKGYHNILWLDSKDHMFVEECGTMNIFFVINGTVVTPSNTGSILSGITRDSSLRLLRDNGYRVEVRRVSIYELEEAFMYGQLTEAFGTGTAATIAPINRIGFNGRDLQLPPLKDRPITNWLSKTLDDIKHGVEDDIYNWVVKI